ncbi:proline--tRNA ligase [bacterium (Candidatus Torokbacteria) CG09_land_8_20_14_0_10_42_11]|nr:MAG: proline--tRNA ligase [bacterium (Candidatus Torokbacteria) CG09_land_8_20_14_0_10_42_11]
MKLSKYPIKTSKDDPKDADMKSYRLMLRAGFLEQIASGVFVYLPLMRRVLRKVEQIVREEMDRAGAIELSMPILQPKELWEQTGRWQDYMDSGTMFHMKDRKKAEMGLAPTHEEVITFVASRRVKSHRDLPVNFYQIGTKFRDELRPRGGLVRTREFIMKDAYSFDADQKGLDASYEKMRVAYMAAFTRCGLKFTMVEADSGAIGGSASHEFMVESEAGEDTLLLCDCGYAANLEKATSRIETPAQDDSKNLKHLEHTPNCRSVEELSKLFNMPAAKMVKTILYEARYKDGKEEVIAVLMRGDLEINEVKLAKSLGKPVAALTIGRPEIVVEKTKAEVGFAGPIGLEDVRLIADTSVEPLHNFLCGGNKTDYHWLDVNIGRDFPIPPFVDLRNAKEGDQCSRCDGKLRTIRGIEIGHLFKLGDKYSRRPTGGDPTGLSAVYLDEKGKEQNILMGCYGIGITRIPVCALEQESDDKGMIWPSSISPYHLVIVVADNGDQEQNFLAEKIYNELSAKGVEVVLDDREERMGFKLNDADLIGYPYQLIVGRRSKNSGIVELKNRKTGEKEEIPAAEAVEKISAIIQEALKVMTEVKNNKSRF